MSGVEPRHVHSEQIPHKVADLEKIVLQKTFCGVQRDAQVSYHAAPSAGPTSFVTRACLPFPDRCRFLNLGSRCHQTPKECH